MRVLVACEYSGTVRDVFIKKGHDAMSCDLLPTETPGPHYQGDVFDIINDGWDIMIGFPPCIYVSYAATKYWYTPGRARKRLAALTFFLDLWEAPIELICLENHLGCIDAVIEKHTQRIEPYYFGDRELKRTCLWLKGLPKLVHQKQDDLFGLATHTARPEPIYIDKSGKKRYITDATGGYHGDGNSFKKRSKTFPSIAEAMAEQWG